MKIAKSALQKNVSLDKDYYTEYGICQMLESGEVAFFDKNFKEIHDGEAYRKMFASEQRETDIVIFTDDLEEIKVVLEDGHYKNIAIGKNGMKYHITL